MIRIAESAAPSCNCPIENDEEDLVAVVVGDPSPAVGTLGLGFRSRSSVAEQPRRPSLADIRPSCSGSSYSSVAHSSGRSVLALPCLRQIQEVPSASRRIGLGPDSFCGSMCRHGAPPS